MTDSDKDKTAESVFQEILEKLSDGDEPPTAGLLVQALREAIPIRSVESILQDLADFLFFVDDEAPHLQWPIVKSLYLFNTAIELLYLPQVRDWAAKKDGFTTWKLSVLQNRLRDIVSDLEVKKARGHVYVKTRADARFG